MLGGSKCVLAILTFAVAPGVAFAADVGELALIPDTGRQIHQSALIGSRYAQRAACAFYQSHADNYDALFVFTSIPMTMLTRTQQGWSTRKAALGIGRNIYPDTTSNYCSMGRLRHVVKMGDIGSFADDPDAIYTGALDFTLSGVQLMGHEFGHQWLAGFTFTGNDGIRHCMMRSFTGSGETPTNPDCDGYMNSDFNQHWSAFFNTGSVMYGNLITDLGGGQFRLENISAKYSELDQYAMGLRDASEVSPMFLVNTGGPSNESAAFPRPVGQPETISGTRVDFTIADVIRAEGPRDPARDICHWKAAFAIVHDENTPPTAAELARVDAYRQRWESWYATATDHRGSFDTTLAGTGPGTVECPSTGTPPPPDAGTITFPDAEPATPDTGNPIAPDTGVHDDAIATADPDAMPHEEPNYAEPDAGPPDDRIKTLVTDDCACTSVEARSEINPAALLLLLALMRVRARSRRSSRATSRAPSSRSAAS